MVQSTIDIVIPIKNEAGSVSELVHRIDKTMRSHKIAYRVIFVDDHSTDETVRKVSSLKLTFPVVILQKVGPAGKAYSILEGAAHGTAPFIVMLDADLEYPPEAIPEMLKEAQAHGIVVANRKVYKSPLMRRITSRLNAFVFGKLLFGFTCDIQSGLKLFRREVVEHVSLKDVKPWALDIPLLFTARELGHTIGTVDITFEMRKNGSKVKVARVAWEIASNAISLRFRPLRTYSLQSKGSALGAGIVHKRKRFITHSHLPHGVSAFKTLSRGQKFMLGFISGLLVGGIVLNLYVTVLLFVAVLSTIYFVDVLFNVYVTLKSLHRPPELAASSEELAKLDKKILPLYTVLCPLYREAHVLPHFLDAVSLLDWPKHKLEVLLLLEDDDKETIEVASKLDLPSYVKTIIIPHSEPKTKPKALNYGLAHARGKFIVIYDAEDKPDPLQLKKAYFAFSQAPESVVCLQAKLNYFNPHQNVLTRLFTAEYSLWFDVILPGLQSIETAIPLGGTSNHFKVDVLRKMHGWDAFNVTEDADLGVRLFRLGYKTAIIDSITYEEANSQVRNWIRQRSRWLKGYLQTYLVHMRTPFAMFREQGVHALVLQLVVGLRIGFMLINPLLWVATIAYFTLYSLVGPAIESIYPSTVFYMAAFSLVFGNFTYLYNYMIGCAKRGHWSLIKFVFLVPLYWLLVSLAAVVALIQLITKPHYWEKTHHGLHLKKTAKELGIANYNQVVKEEVKHGRLEPSLLSGAFLVLASVLGNVFSFLYNAFLGRSVSLEQFGLISLLSSFFYIAQILFIAIGKTTTYKSAYIYGKYKVPAFGFWQKLSKSALKISLITTGLWMIVTPFLASFFKTESIMPFVLFAPVWLFGTLGAVNGGYLSGNLRFATVAVIAIIEALVKFGLTVLVVQLGYPDYVYSVIPISIFVALCAGWASISVLPKATHEVVETLKFPKRFFSASLATSFSQAAFLSFDVILAKHYLSPIEAGHYGLLSLVGKMIFFVGTLLGQFIVPLVSKAEGAGGETKQTFNKLFSAAALSTLVAYIGVGLLGNITVPILLGDRARTIVHLLPFYGLAMTFYSIASSIVSYHLVKKHYIFAIASFVLTLVQVAGIVMLNGSVAQISLVMTIMGAAFLISMVGLHFTHHTITVVLNNLLDFFELFKTYSSSKKINPTRLTILIMNWYDTKHVWAGGAEFYLHNIAKKLISEGHHVTMFTGNDGHQARNEVVEGVQVVRRGGMFSVVIWGFLYYMLRFRGLYDVVIDNAKGVPFFTPLYAQKPVIGVVHHIHQEMFKNGLSYPIAQFAMWLERVAMPKVYKNVSMVTVSESSRASMKKFGFGKHVPIRIVSPGVEIEKPQVKKTQYPSILYLGRLRAYKRVDVLLAAFSQVNKAVPTARLTIAGSGETLTHLKKQAKALNLSHVINFTGQVSEAKKAELFAQSWIVAHPSIVEGWGISNIEANICGTPVVASNVDGLKDSVVHGETGILVEPNNPVALAKALTTLLKNDQLRKKLAKEAEVWGNSFSWDITSAKFRDIIYEEVSRRPILPYGQKMSLAREL